MINWAHVHLMINHFPVIGIFGAILLFLYALIRKSEEVEMVSLGFFVLLALITLPVFFTGEAAESVVKNLPDVTETYIDRHEESAEYSITLMELLGAASLAGLIYIRRSGAVPKWLLSVVLALSLITAAVVGYTANLGGQVRHTEIREGSVSSASPVHNN
jgi:DMSO reductase anchor subunit